MDPAARFVEPMRPYTEEAISFLEEIQNASYAVHGGCAFNEFVLDTNENGHETEAIASFCDDLRGF